MSAKKHVSVSWFWIFLGVYCIILIAGILYGLSRVTSMLREYEENLPDKAAQAVFDEYFGEGLHRAAEEYGPESSKFENAAAYETLLKETVGEAPLNYFEVPSEEDACRKYTVAAKSTRVGSFVIEPNENREEARWKLKSVELVPLPTFAVTVTAHSGDTVKINGVALGGDEIVSTDRSHYTNEIMPVNENGEPVCEGIATVTYKAEGLYFEPEVTVTDRNGTELAVDKTGDVTYITKLSYDDARIDEVGERALSTAQNYCRYMRKTVSQEQLALFIPIDSDLYYRITHASINWNSRLESQVFSDVKLSELYFYDENVFSCRVSFTETCRRPNVKKDYVFDFDAVLFFHRTSRVWMLYEMQFVE